MRIALASPPIATSLDGGIRNVARLTAAASAQGAAIVCFPEAYLPGLRGQDFDVALADADRALEAGCDLARTHRIALILGLEKERQIVAAVIDASGEIQGFQAKCQLDPSEEAHYVPGSKRRMFEAGGVKFGIAICHEGWRYPETVRWAAMRGAKIVFHPQLTGSDRQPPSGDAYYPKAQAMRAIENTIWFASVNYGLRYPESPTCVVDPNGNVVASMANEGVLVSDVDVDAATGMIARRFAPERY